jgi:Na+-translocating ferredoxin:NAD+ oxidoreductase subunit G
MNKATLWSSPFLLLWLFAATSFVLLTAAREVELRLVPTQQQQVEERLLDEILANVPHDNQLRDDTFQLVPKSGIFAQEELLGLTGARTAYIARQQDQVTALVLPAATLEGYNGKIELLMGVTADGEIAGVRVVTHAETPRLGDQIELALSNWVLSFNNRSLDNTDPLLWRVKKDGGEFDQFAGATITPRAVVGAIHDTLEFFSANRDVLLGMRGTALQIQDVHNPMVASPVITAWLAAMMQPLPLLLMGLLLALKNFLSPKGGPPPASPDGFVAGSKRVRVTGKP